jgi:hypothetical protein
MCNVLAGRAHIHATTQRTVPAGLEAQALLPPCFTSIQDILQLLPQCQPTRGVDACVDVHSAAAEHHTAAAGVAGAAQYRQA